LLVERKCPLCNSKKIKLLKNWKYQEIEVTRYLCKCGKKFNFYKSSKNKSWTIPKMNKNQSDHPLFGKHRSEEVKKKLSIAQTGKKFSEEHKKKLSEAKKGEKNPFFGKHHSEETLKKLRVGKRSRKTS